MIYLRYPRQAPPASRFIPVRRASHARAGIGAKNPSEEFMTNPPPRNHKITAAEARALMGKRHKELTTRGGHFPREAIDAILAQPGCTGIRFYYGGNADGSPAIV